MDLSFMCDNLGLTLISFVWVAMRLDINILCPYSLSIRLNTSHLSIKWAHCERTINFSFIAILTTFISHNLPLLAAVFCGVFLRVPRRPSGSGPAGYSSRATTSLCSPSVPAMTWIYHFQMPGSAYSEALVTVTVKVTVSVMCKQHHRLHTAHF